MQRILIILFCMATMLAAKAQTAGDLQETARNFMRQGDFTNAIVVLTRASNMDASNVALKKELGLAYYYNKQNDKAIEIIKPLLDLSEIDDQTFIIATNIYKQLGNVKEAEKVYKSGLKKFPQSGMLYNDYGEMLAYTGQKNAIDQFEAGIKAEPSFNRNYYNAAKYYSVNKEPVWSIIYGEMYANMDPLSLRTAEVKNIVLNQYKEMFANPDLEKAYNKYQGFARQFVENLNRQSALAINGIDAESLTMIRTRFLLDWFGQNEIKYPFTLFNFQQQLLQEGLFDAYNQWLFGAPQNINAYQNWVNTHKEENTAYLNFQKSRIFKMQPGEYYK